MKKSNSRLIQVITPLLSIAMLTEQIGTTLPLAYVYAEGKIEEKYSIEHNVNATWEGGCNAEIKLQNFADKEVKDWSLVFCAADEITYIWGGRITECKEIADDSNKEEYDHYYVYTVEAEDYTRCIPAGNQVTVGYNAKGYVHDIWDAEAELVFDDTDLGAGADENPVPVGGSYAGEGYAVDVDVTDIWEGAYNVKLQIRNTSVETIHNWGFVMKTSDKISGLYNAVELSDKDGVRLIKNAVYNQDIAAGGCVEVGYTAFYENSADVPKEFALSQLEKEVDMTECEVSLFVTDEWEEGGMAQIIIENTSGQVIEDWMLEFDSTMNIAGIWGGVVESHNDEHYFIRNEDYAQNIPAGEAQTVEILFNGKVSDIRNVRVSQIVTDGETVPAIPTPTPAADEDIDYVTDTDGEGIPDAYEESIGTDPTLKDTDGDGLDDYIEVFVLNSDPLVYDSIISGVSDGDADSDNDGLNNIDELNLDLNPTIKDTDYDGLDDGDEIKLYGTDPKNEDTDGDGLKDGEEIRLGLDPLSQYTYGVADNEYKVQQTIDKESESLIRINKEDNPYSFSLDIKAAGCVEDNIDVCEPMEASVIQNDAMLGMAIHMYYDRADSVESVTLRFEINEEYVIDNSVNYPDITELQGIHRYNVFHYFEDKHMLLPVETFFDDDNNTIYAETDELGTYCLMDMERVFERISSIDLTETIDDQSIVDITDKKEMLESSTPLSTSVIQGSTRRMSMVSTLNEGADTSVPDGASKTEGGQVINLFFILFHAGESESIYQRERDLIPELLEKLQKENKGYRYRVYVLNPDSCWWDYNGDKIVWYDNPDALREMLSSTDYYKYYNGALDFDDAGSVLSGLLKKIVSEDPTSRNYVYNCTSTYYFTSRANISKPSLICEKYSNNIVYSEIGKYVFWWSEDDPTNDFTYVERTGGKRWICEGDMVGKVYTHITGLLPESSEDENGGGGSLPLPGGDIPDIPEPEEPKEKELVNLVFALQTSGSDENLFNEQVTMIPNLLEKLQNESKEYQYRVSVIATSGEGTSNLLLNNDDTMWFNDVQVLRNSLSSLTYYKTNVKTSLAEIFKTLSWLMEEISENRNYVFLLHNGDIEHNTETANPKEFCANYMGRINYSELGNKTNYWEGEDPTGNTGGKSWNYYEGMNIINTLYVHITKESQQNIQPRKAYPALTLTGWSIIELATELNATNGTDTDGDSITDWDEVDTSLLKLNNGEYELPSITECMESVNKSYVKDGLSRFDVEVGDSIENEQKIQEIYRQTRVLPILSDPTSVDSDGDGFEDKSDERPLISDTITVNLPNVYDIDYLNIDGKYDGGNQYWWGYTQKDEWLFWTNEDYRLSMCGCGVIAMSDLEMYLIQQNNGYQPVYPKIQYNTNDGCISKSDYMNYVKDNFDDKYIIEACALNRIGGLLPSYMEIGICEFLCQHNSTFSKAHWAPSITRTGVATRIETMICKGIPVVFSYYSPDDFLYMYSSIDDARMMINDVDYVDSHYMTILGWTKYVKDNGEFGYILKIISCGEIYYINYDNFARKIGPFTNILEIE